MSSNTISSVANFLGSIDSKSPLELKVKELAALSVKKQSVKTDKKDVQFLMNEFLLDKSKAEMALAGRDLNSAVDYILSN